MTAVTSKEGAGGIQIADVGYADGPAERYVLLADELRWAPLLRRLGRGPLRGPGGHLELRPGPALEALLGEGDAERVPSVDQSNTILVVGGKLLVKVYRRIEAGLHPEVEVLTALAGGPAPVPSFAGSVHWRSDDGDETAIAILQAYVPDAQSGWEPPILEAARALEDGAPYDVRSWAALGRAAAHLHLALAEAFPPRPATAEDALRWHADASSAWAAAVVLEPALGAHDGQVARRLAPLAIDDARPVTRVHGDLHVAQLLRSGEDTSSLLFIDFESDPTRPLAERRRPDTPLRDLASLLRCVDHVGSAASRRVGGRPPDRWIEAATDAVLAAWSQHATPPDAALLAALELAKECNELMYAHRVLPEWGYAPRLGLQRLLERP